MGEILKDHKKKGKVLTPPLLTVGKFQFSNYIENTVPELIWITLLNDKYGIQFGTKLGLQFVKIIRDVMDTEEIPFYISYFSKIDQDIILKATVEMKKQGVYEVINKAISPLLNLYPLCPLNRLFLSKKHSSSDIDSIKSTLIQLYDKRSKEATFTLGNVMYFMAAHGKLQIVKGSVLSELPKLVDYPDTEISKLIASGIRASSNVFMNKPLVESDEKWINHFWNTGMQLEPCKI